MNLIKTIMFMVFPNWFVFKQRTIDLLYQPIQIEDLFVLVDKICISRHCIYFTFKVSTEKTYVNPKVVKFHEFHKEESRTIYAGMKSDVRYWFTFYSVYSHKQNLEFLKSFVLSEHKKYND